MSMPGGNAMKGRGGGGSAGGKNTKVTEAGVASTSAGQQDGGGSGAGAPKKDILGVCQRIWDEFCKSDEHGPYFNKDASRVRIQYVIRWSNGLRAKIGQLAEDSDEKVVLEVTLSNIVNGGRFRHSGLWRDLGHLTNATSPDLH